MKEGQVTSLIPKNGPEAVKKEETKKVEETQPKNESNTNPDPTTPTFPNLAQENQQNVRRRTAFMHLTRTIIFLGALYVIVKLFSVYRIKPEE